MANIGTDFKKWHDWTDPDFFNIGRTNERRLVPLFMRQLLPHRLQSQKNKLTITGWLLILVAMGIGTAAYNTSSNILFMTLSLLLSSLILNGILSLINFNKLDWQLKAPSHLRAGAVGVAEIQLRNEKSVFPTMGICFRVEDSETHRLTRLYLKHGLGPGKRTELEWTFEPLSRGRLLLRLSGVESQFPFGFLRKTLGASLEEPVTIWPARCEYEFELKSGGHRLMIGASKRNAGLGSDLLNIRPYVRGDAPRLVHWRATARTGQLMIRQLAEEGESGYHIIVDPSDPEMTKNHFECLCSLVCSLAEDLMHAGRLETFTILGQDTMAIHALKDLHALFDQVALLEQNTSARKKSLQGPFRSNRITFRAEENQSIVIYVDQEKAGRTNDG